MNVRVRAQLGFSSWIIAVADRCEPAGSPLRPVDEPLDVTTDRAVAERHLKTCVRLERIPDNPVIDGPMLAVAARRHLRGGRFDAAAVILADPRCPIEVAESALRRAFARIKLDRWGETADHQRLIRAVVAGERWSADDLDRFEQLYGRDVVHLDAALMTARGATPDQVRRWYGQVTDRAVANAAVATGAAIPDDLVRQVLSTLRHGDDRAAFVAQLARNPRTSRTMLAAVADLVPRSARADFLRHPNVPLSFLTDSIAVDGADSPAWSNPSLPAHLVAEMPVRHALEWGRRGLAGERVPDAADDASIPEDAIAAAAEIAPTFTGTVVDLATTVRAA
jgi:hypothetical protein